MAPTDGRRLGLALAVLLALALPCAGEEPKPADPDNAATHYRKATALLTPYNSLSAAERKLLGDPSAPGPLGDAAKELLERNAAALKEVRLGVRAPRCDWEHKYDETGPATVLSGLQEARNLGNLLSLHLRTALAAHQTDAALEDLADGLALGRHVAEDKAMIALLINYAVERRFLQTAAVELQGQDARTLRALAARLDAAPRGPSAADSLRFERGFMRKWWAKTLRHPSEQTFREIDFFNAVSEEPCFKGPPDELAFQVRQFVNASGLGEVVAASNVVMIASALVEVATDPTALERMQTEADELWEEEARIHALPLAEAEAAMRKFRDKVLASPRLVRLMGPDCSLRLRQAELRNAAFRDMFRTALAVVADGPDAVKAHRDPLSDGPFVYREFKGGFELTSKYRTANGSAAAMKLVVGRESKE